jgi:transposase
MTTQQMDAVGAGRGGRMSRQRKRDAVLRLLRDEDLDMVSRSLGCVFRSIVNGHSGGL